MSSPVDRPTDTPQTGWRLAAAMVAAPALVLAAHLVQATPVRHDTAAELGSIAAAQGRYEISMALAFGALVLYVPALLGLARPVLARTAARVGVGMAVTGLIAFAQLMGSGPYGLVLARWHDRSAAVRITDAYESTGLVGIWGLVMVIGFSLGPIVIGVTRWRAGGSWLVPALLVAGLVLQIADAGRWPLAAGFACLVAAYAAAAGPWAAVAAPRTPEADRVTA